MEATLKMNAKDAAMAIVRRLMRIGRAGACFVSEAILGILEKEAEESSVVARGREKRREEEEEEAVMMGKRLLSCATGRKRGQGGQRNWQYVVAVTQKRMSAKIELRCHFGGQYGARLELWRSTKTLTSLGRSTVAVAELTLRSSQGGRLTCHIQSPYLG